MSMKAKPNTTQFQLPKDPTAFLEGGEADKAEKPLAAPPPAATRPAGEEAARYGRARVQKIFNFPEELADRLRREALMRSEEKGGRVTEKDIVIEALEAFLKHR
ncbi:hypothetical protein [Pandoraea oxalativorans]|uniref:Uncharacterized protein n=1 Tax=Pandoraea oxalativorans TaxID=573737 RepID=A0A0G3IEX8_9BURK|nr:hypothetical protein [Pandoraea oxalativorans]AKK25118.1 hypothetical protein MB84_30835 [Pandoraea oxalativorans]